MFSPFFVIKSVNEEKREVGGLITCERVDKDGETLAYGPSKPFFQAWSDEALHATQNAGQALSYGNLREQHSKRCVGKFVEPLKFDDQGKTIWGLAKVSDDDVWAKVKDGVYTGFSCGGALAGPVQRVGKARLITIIPREISLVDNPAVDSAHFDFVRAADGQVMKVAFKHESPQERLKSALSELQDAVSKFLAPEIVPEEKVSGVSGSDGAGVAAAADPALKPVPNPPEDPDKVAPPAVGATVDNKPVATEGAAMAPKGTTYAPDAIPDKTEPHANTPVDGQVHMSAETRKYDPTSAAVIEPPDTHLSTLDGTELKPTAAHEPGSNTELVGETKAAMAIKVEKHDHVVEPAATIGTPVTPDPMIEVDDIGHQLEAFGLPADKTDPEHDETSIEKSLVVKVAPSGWEDTIQGMKEHPGEIDNPWALAWWMENEGYTPQKLSKAAAIEFQAVYKSAIEKRAFSDKKRADLADKGHAMPDGSYPIETAGDLSNAVQAFGRHPTDAVKAHIKKRAAQLGREDLLPENWKTSEKAVGTEKNKLSTATLGDETIMSKETEVQKAAQKSLADHLHSIKKLATEHKAALGACHAELGEKHEAAVHAAVDKCMKLAGAPEFDADTERTGGQPASGSPEAATDTEVKAAKAEIEKLSLAVATLTDLVKAQAKPVEKAAEVTTVVGDATKAVPNGTLSTVDKAAADQKEQEKVLTLAKAAMGVRTVNKEVDGKVVERQERVSPDPKAMDALYYQLTDAKTYMAGHAGRS